MSILTQISVTIWLTSNSLLYTITLFVYIRNLNQTISSTQRSSSRSSPTEESRARSTSLTPAFLNRPLPSLPPRQAALQPSPSVPSFPVSPEPEKTPTLTFNLTEHDRVRAHHAAALNSRDLYHLDPYSAAEAGIRPPTPVQRALDAGITINQSPVEDDRNGQEQNTIHENCETPPRMPDSTMVTLPTIVPVRPLSFDVKCMTAERQDKDEKQNKQSQLDTYTPAHLSGHVSQQHLVTKHRPDMQTQELKNQIRHSNKYTLDEDTRRANAVAELYLSYVHEREAEGSLYQER